MRDAVEFVIFNAERILRPKIVPSRPYPVPSLSHAEIRALNVIFRLRRQRHARDGAALE